MTSRPRVAILFGGCSEEHDVSVKSAMEVATSIDPQKYESIYIGITKRGVWRMCDRPHAAWDDGTGRRAVISPDRETHGLIVGEVGESRAVHVDVVFPVLHGKSGEDGAIQGLLELSGIPYVGCDIQSSAICMDKSLAYVVAANAGIETPAFSVLDRADKAAPNELVYPVFVKPARSGSSFGVTRVDDAEALDAAISTAREYDGKILIEQAIFGSEVGCAVLGNGTDLLVGEVDQITLSHGIFRIHQEAQPEQGSENAVVTVPANASAEMREEIRATAKVIYMALGCKGLARVDMFLQDDGRVVLNEVNTLPGFTSYSRYPRMMAAAGLDRSELIDRLISLAMGQ
jgi:D-alanine--(R)-lactate ligase